jgi:hypothetical protein
MWELDRLQEAAAAAAQAAAEASGLVAISTAAGILLRHQHIQQHASF